MTRFAPPIPSAGRRPIAQLPPDLAALLEEPEPGNGADPPPDHAAPSPAAVAATRDVAARRPDPPASRENAGTSLPPDLAAMLREPDSDAGTSLPPDLAALLREPDFDAGTSLPPDLGALLEESESTAVAARSRGLAARLRPSEASPLAAERAATQALLIGVVAPEGLTAAATGGLGAWLRRRDRSAVVVVAASGPAGAGRPATRRAGGLARHLAGRGFATTGSGSLCRVALPDEPITFVAEARRLRADLDPDLPLVVGAAARNPEVDALLAVADELILALPPSVDDALAELARTSLTRIGPPMGEIRVPTDPLGRRAAALGLRPLAPWTPEPAEVAR